MIQPHTLDEIPRGDPREYLRRDRRGGRARLPEQRRAMYIGGGGISIPGDPLGASGGVAPFSGNFASLFPGAYHFLQSDRGLSYGAVMRANAGNTSGVSFALTGATPAVPVPIWIRITAPGVGNVYYDGLGAAPAMVGVTIVDGFNIVLTGAGLGMAITPGVGSQVAGDTWKATCSGLADQTPNGINAVQLTPAQQPIVMKGLNGKVTIAGDGLAGFMKVLLALPVPSVTPYYVFAVFRMTDIITNCSLFGRGDASPNTHIFYCTSATSLDVYDGLDLNNFRLQSGLNTWLELEKKTSNSASDFLKLGTNTVLGSSGNNSQDPSGIQIFASGSGAFGPFELAALTHTPVLPDWVAVRAAINSAAGYGAGNVETCV